MIGSFLERPFLIRMVFFFSFTVTVPLLALVCVSETDGSDGADEEEGDVEAEPDGAADDEAPRAIGLFFLFLSYIKGSFPAKIAIF